MQNSKGDKKNGKIIIYAMNLRKMKKKKFKS